MPLYDYLCQACGHRFETLVRAGATPACPRCGGTALDKQVSAPAAPGKSKAVVAAARRQAAREGHFSQYSAAERNKLLR
ncbi:MULTISPECIES: FmdB family zinc ribbon protein [Cupriavidus]